jgi:CheY-like chemotaxis protein
MFARKRIGSDRRLREYDASRPMVLIVDDNPDTCVLLTRCFRRGGIACDSVMSGADALAFMQRQPPAVVILDVMMPDMSGIDVVRTIRRIDPLKEVPVIIYSGDSSYSVLQKAMQAGAQSFIVKGTVGLDQLVSEARFFL